MVGCATEDAVETSAGNQTDTSPGETTSPAGTRYDELLIKGGTVVTEAGIQQCDLRVAGERISEIGSALSSSTAYSITIDASGLHVLPGGIDPHVHLSEPWCDDFQSSAYFA